MCKQRKEPAIDGKWTFIKCYIDYISYIFDRNFIFSVSKHFSTKVHILLKPALSFDAYLSIRELKRYDWCMDIEVSPPPADWISSLSLCVQLLAKACKSKNLLDIHTA
ncbi:hypothetical protein BCV72DRAFT_327440 [Rhizopus microsporus var. microsporus]|uniref:Uncharacterized protein n=1 Tax=Rhizopus microsporus var. microsporus TaxID=86635 RepID=A0A1X0RH26_RHIZD|nr:hypothetical protein BCV72DRAFT_327440 [Rhizopus microsporus var. microsporus]